MNSRLLALASLACFSVTVLTIPTQAGWFCHHGQHTCRWCQNASGNSTSSGLSGQSGQTQQFFTIDASTLLLTLLKNAAGGGGGGGDAMTAKLDKLTERVEGIEKLIKERVNENTTAIDRLVKSEELIANATDDKLEGQKKELQEQVDQKLAALKKEFDQKLDERFGQFDQKLTSFLKAIPNASTHELLEKTPYFDAAADVETPAKKTGEWQKGTMVRKIKEDGNAAHVQSQSSETKWILKSALTPLF